MPSYVLGTAAVLTLPNNGSGEEHFERYKHL